MNEQVAVDTSAHTVHVQLEEAEHAASRIAGALDGLAHFVSTLDGPPLHLDHERRADLAGRVAELAGTLQASEACIGFLSEQLGLFAAERRVHESAKSNASQLVTR